MKNGDLLKASSELVSLIDHYGILVVLDDGTQHVLHCVPFKGVVMDTLDDFKRNRTIVEVQPTDLNGVAPGKIIAKAQAMSTKPYDVLYFNCEHFINRMLNEEVVSHQLVNYLPWIAAISAALWLLAPLFMSNGNSNQSANP